MKIPFNRPALVGKEMGYIQQAIVEHGHLAGDGVFTHQSQALLQELTGASKALLTSSCTDALEMAAILADIQAGDEVIVPAFTFVSTINAFVLRGASPVFVDIRPDTLNMDETLLERAITPRTKAIVPVHYAGVGCEMDTILALAEPHHLVVVEDNAHGLFGKYKGRKLGTFGALATQSFHETKNITCGEGGALLINDPQYLERAEIIREKGTNRSRFYMGLVDKYTWVDIGSSYLLSDLNAAYLYAQLEAYDTIQAKRQQLWMTYQRELAAWAEKNGVGLPFIPDHCEQPYHMFYMLMPSLEKRQALLQHLREADVLAVFHYQPLHLSDMGLRFGGQQGDCPVTEDIADRLVRLPFYFALSEQEQAKVIELIVNS